MHGSLVLVFFFWCDILLYARQNMRRRWGCILKPRDNGACSEPVQFGEFWLSAILEVKVWGEVELSILLLAKGHGHVNTSFSARTSQFNKARNSTWGGTGWGCSTFSRDWEVRIWTLEERSKRKTSLLPRNLLCKSTGQKTSLWT